MGWGLPRLALVASVALFGAGCAYNDRVDNRVATYDIAAERARDEMILTNIIRASRAEPLAFIQLGQVTGGATAGAQLGLPSLVLGPPASTVATQALQSQAVFGANAAQSGFASNYVQMSGSTTFNITPSETRDFYLGLLTVVEPATLDFFTEQGVAPELLFYLFTDKIIEEKNGKVREFQNNPFDAENFEGFKHYVALAMQYGLSAEPEPGSEEALLKKEKEKSKFSITVNVASSGGGGEGEKQSSDEGKAIWRLCFDRTRWHEGLKFADNTPLCGSRTKLPDERAVTFLDQRGEKVKLRILPRSTFAIFQFLGRLLASGYPLKLISPDAIGAGTLQDQNLFVVSNGSPYGCFLQVNYEGQNYCVPNNAANTKRIIGLLVQLLALNTSIRDLAITPQVQLLQ